MPITNLFHELARVVRRVSSYPRICLHPRITPLQIDIIYPSKREPFSELFARILTLLWEGQSWIQLRIDFDPLCSTHGSELWLIDVPGGRGISAYPLTARQPFIPAWVAMKYKMSQRIDEVVDLSIEGRYTDTKGGMVHSSPEQLDAIRLLTKNYQNKNL